MKVLVLGGGVIGVTSAWYLAQAGHEVTLIDRQPGPARETSFANAGELSYGYCGPWAAPGVPLKALKWLAMEHAPLILKPKPDLAMLGWMARMLMNCTKARYQINKGRMLRLADYSRLALAELRAQTQIDYDGQRQGTLQLFRTEAQLAASEKDIRALRADGIPCALLTPEACIAAEPALAQAAGKFVGGLQTPQDETGDCYKFTAALAVKSEAAGVVFHWNQQITHLLEEAGRVCGCRTASGAEFRADALVVALGSWSAALLRPLGINLPVYPVKGYSLTLPICDASRAPLSTVMDESYKIAITRLGNRIRVGGMAEISGYGMALDPRRRRTLEYSVTDLFPGGDLARGEFWAGLRPMTPDGTPVIGATARAGLYLNTGHGTLGWTMSAGSGRLLADLVTRKPPEIDARDLALSRYSKEPPAGIFREGERRNS